MYIIADVKESKSFENFEEDERNSVNSFYRKICGIALSISYLMNGIKIKGYTVDWAELMSFFANRGSSTNSRVLCS